MLDDAAVPRRRVRSPAPWRVLNRALRFSARRSKTRSGKTPSRRVPRRGTL